MMLDTFKGLADLFFKHAENNEETQRDFVQYTFDNILRDCNSEDFTNIVEELLNRVSEDIVYSYLIQVYDGTSEHGLAQLVAKMPVDFSQEIIYAASELAKNEENPDGLNLNVLLMSFINNTDRETVADYEAKIKSIIKCMNEATKMRIALLKEKEAELQALRFRMTEQVSTERVLAELKAPIAALESYIAFNILKSTKHPQRLIEIADDIRKKLEELYGIGALESYDNWVTQSSVEYNPEKHILSDKPKGGTEELQVRVESRGFVLQSEAGIPQIIRANVCAAQKPKQKTK